MLISDMITSGVLLAAWVRLISRKEVDGFVAIIRITVLSPWLLELLLRKNKTFRPHHMKPSIIDPAFQYVCDMFMTETDKKSINNQNSSHSEILRMADDGSPDPERGYKF